LGEKLKDAKLKGMVNELLDACVKITEVGLDGSEWLVKWLGLIICGFVLSF